MDLEELEKKIIALESDSTLAQTANALSLVSQLKKDIGYVKSQLNRLG